MANSTPKILVVHGYAVNGNHEIDERGKAVYNWLRKNHKNYEMILLPGGRDNLELGEETLISDIMRKDLHEMGINTKKLHTPRTLRLLKTHCPARDTIEEIGWVGLMLDRLQISSDSQFDVIGFCQHTPRLKLIYDACGIDCQIHGTKDTVIPCKKTIILQRFATTLAKEDPFGEGKIFQDNREKRTFPVDRTKQPVKLKLIWNK